MNNKKRWNTIKTEDRADYTHKHTDKYFLLIGIRSGKKLYEYIDGHCERSKMLDLMHHMMRQDDCPFYIMAVHDCANTQGAITDVLTKANRDRGDETDSKE